MWKPVQEFFRRYEFNLREDLLDPFLYLRLTQTAMPCPTPLINFKLSLDPQWLSNDLLDDHAGIKRLIGILKDNLHFSTKRLQFAISELRNVLTLEEYATTRRADEAQKHFAKGRFAAPTLSRKSEDFPLLRVKLTPSTAFTFNSPLEKTVSRKPLLRGYHFRRFSTRSTSSGPSVEGISVLTDVVDSSNASNVLVQMARGKMVLLAVLNQHWLFALADIHHERTAGVEPARWGRMQKIWRLAWDRSHPNTLALDARKGFDESLRVWMLRILEYRPRIPILHNLSSIHYRDLLTGLCDYR